MNRRFRDLGNGSMGFLAAQHGGIIGPDRLILAIQEKCAWLAILIMKDPIDVNYEDESGGTALHFAIHYNNTEVILALIQDPDIRVNISHTVWGTAVHMAIYKLPISQAWAILTHKTCDLSSLNPDGSTLKLAVIRSDGVLK